MTQLPNQENYDASQIEVLEGLEPVRKRPGMYIGSTDIRGLHHCVAEIVDNSVDEAMAGFCKNITVIIHSDGKVTCFDDGRGIPVDKHQKTGKSALETVFTVLHAGGKFEKSAYKISGGLHGVGASVVNALSEELTATVHKNGKIYQQVFHRGVPQGDIEIVGETDVSGTTVSFKPDKEIFETTKFVYSTLSTRLKHSAYLTPGVTFSIVDEASDQKERFYYEGGIKTWLGNLVGEQKAISPLAYVNQEGKDCRAEIAFQYVDSPNDSSLSFVNNISTTDGGTHVNGFKTALLTVINEFAKAKGQLDNKIGEFQPSDVADGLYAIVTVKIPEPQFEGQTKGRLGNSYVKKEVEEIMSTYLKDFFSQNESVFMAILEKVNLSARARMAAKLAKETILRKNVFAGGVLPGKLADCSNKGKEGTELFIVEGNSAGGSAKQGRNSAFQAILPLKGKILNTEQAMINKILLNEEVKSLITAIGAGLKEGYDMEKLRYDKIVIMTDADVDGAHIRTLLLTFFFRYMRPLIENGNLFIAVPPIYKLKQGKKEQYVYPPIESLEHAIQSNGFELGKTEVQRYKGLGEMNPEQLRETTMDPVNRKMLQVTVEDAEDADKLFRILMGEDVMSRKHFILTHAKSVKDLDI
ncbi:MAG TPA: DNA topoisomerase subunit B [Candidatus Absconditabacterales bacterium]|nr:DNA topoisomerase subunit B [Candidatus Absconditabacterales bacterium]